jgi:hypothetical protein
LRRSISDDTSERWVSFALHVETAVLYAYDEEDNLTILTNERGKVAMVCSL